MATKKSASKKTAGSASGTDTPAAEKTAAKKSAGKKTVASAPAKKNADVAEASQASAEPKGNKSHPSHHDIQVRAYLLAQKDHHRHHNDFYWHKAEHELAAE